MDLEIFLAAGASFFAAATLFLALRFRGLISVHQLGQVEGSLEHLKRVVVLAHRVEPPNDELREAVEMNFARGVKYLFLISQSSAQAELHGYFDEFRVISDIVRRREGLEWSEDDLVEIQQLPYDWEEAPYIFYEVLREGADRPEWFAYEGTQKMNGVADFYVEVPKRDARRLATTVLAGAPTPVKIDAAQLVDARDVLSIADHRQRGVS